ncbi:MAG: hypothetical protein Q9192_006723, partial [Flavoplaca navasiana]
MGCRISKSATKEEPSPPSFRVISNPTIDPPSMPRPTESKSIKKADISAPTAVPFNQFVAQVGTPEETIQNIPGAFPIPPSFTQHATPKLQPNRPTPTPLNQPIRPQTAPGSKVQPHPLQSHPILQPPRPILPHRSSLPSLIPIPPPPDSPISPCSPSPLRSFVLPPIPYVPPGMTLDQVLAPKGKRRASSLREPGRVVMVGGKGVKKGKGDVGRKERGRRGNRGVSREVRELGWEVEMEKRGGWFWRRRGNGRTKDV